MTEIVGSIFGAIVAFLIMFGIPIALIVAVFRLYRKTKNQETEIAVLKERLRNYEKPKGTVTQADFEAWKAKQ